MAPNPGPSSVFDRLERAFARYARAILRHRGVVLALVLGVTGVFAYAAATRLRVDASTEGLLGSDSPSMLALDALTDTFGPDKTLVLAVRGDVYSARFLERLRRLHRAAEGLELELASAGTRRSDRRRAIRADAPGVGRAPTPAVAAGHDSGDPFAEVGGTGDPFAELGADGTGDTDARADDESEATRSAQGSDLVFENVTSLANAVDLELRDGTLDTDEMLATMPSDLAAFQRRVASTPGLVGGVVDPRGRVALVVLRPRFMDEQDLARVVDATDVLVRRHSAPGFVVERGGFVALEVALNRIMQRDIGLVFTLALVAMIAMLAFLYRSLGAVVTPVAVIILAIVTTHGAMAFGLAPVTGVTSVLATLLLVIGMADAVHVVSAYRDRVGHGDGTTDAIVHAIAETAWPITFTAITDVAGLIGFRASSLEAIRDMGTYGSIGILAALFYTLTLLPVMLSFHRAPKAGTGAGADTGADTGAGAGADTGAGAGADTGAGAGSGAGGGRKPDLVDWVLARCEALSRPRGDGPDRHRGRNRVLLGAAVLSLVAVAGALRTRTVHDPLRWLPADNAERRSVESLEADGFGAADVTLVVRARGDRGLRDPAFVRGLAAVEADVRRIAGPDGRPLVTHVTSVLDLVRDANGAMVGSSSAMPTDRASLSDTMTLIESASPSELGRIATVDLRTTRMVVSVRWLEASAYGPFAARLRASARRHLGSLARVETTGSVFAGFEVTNDLNGSLRASFFTAVLSIALTMILLVFSIRIGLLAMIPNLVPILGMLGTMGMLGLPLDLNGLLVGSIAMGLVVDDTIHVVHAFVRHRRLLGVERAVQHVFFGTGRALIGTGVVLAGGFGFFLLAELENVRRFGGLLALSILIALVGDLVLTPAVLRCLRDEPESDPPGAAGGPEPRVQATSPDAVTTEAV